MTEETRKEAIKASRTAAFWSLLGFIVVAIAMTYIIIRLNSVSAKINDKGTRLAELGQEADSLAKIWQNSMLDDKLRIAPTAYAAADGAGGDYRFTLWTDLSKSNFPKDVSAIRYEFKHPAYPVQQISSRERAQAFRVTYLAPGCLRDVKLQILFADGDSLAGRVDLCEILREQGNLQVPEFQMSSQL